MTRSARLKVCHVGGYPPPIGGISLHVQRLDAHCRSQGIASVVIDPYGGRPAALSGAQVLTVRGGRARRAMELLWNLKRSTADIMHFHLAAQDSFLAIAPMALAASSGRWRVATLHSGGFVPHYWKRSLPARLLARRVFRAFDHVIACNIDQQAFLATEFRLPAGAITVAPAFLLPPAAAVDGQAMPDVARFCDRHEEVALVTGSCRPLYGLHTVLDALDHLRDPRLGIILNLYSKADPPYRDEILRRAQDRSDVLVTSDMEDDAFQAMLRRVSIFLRATSADGDSVALREAIWHGRQIVATDAAPRPLGTLLFKYGDSSGLAHALAAAMADPSAGLCAPGIDSGAAILAVYRSLTGV